MKLLVLAFANDKNILLTNFENSLIKYGYEYKIVGEGEKWVNFMTKIKTCLDFIEKSEYDIICITDAYDVLACDAPYVLIKKFKKFKKNIVAGAENDCGSNCVPLNEYFEYNESGRYNYANGGFYIGYKESIIELLNFILELKISDDQIGLGKYINKYPNDISLDINGTLISNVNIKSSYYDTYFVNKSVKNIKTGKHPCFIHTPSIQFDLYRRMDYFGNKILDNYKSYNFSDKCKNFYKKYYFKFNIFIIIIVLLIILLLLNYGGSI